MTLNCTMEDITEQEEIVAQLRDNIKTERSQRWRLWVENSWAHKNKDIYRWIKGSKSAGPLIVIPGAEEFPEFEDQPMEPITEDEIRRVVIRLVDGKAKGVDGWSPAEL
eukprot:9951768-Heterocapsa_arctica.AAC.1